MTDFLNRTVFIATVSWQIVCLLTAADKIPAADKTADAATVVKVVVVPDGQVPRDGTCVFPLVPAGEAWALIDDAGQHYTVVRCGDFKARGHLPPLSGETTFTAAPITPPPAAITISQKDDRVQFTYNDKDIVAFQGGAGVLPTNYEENYRRGGYLARLATPSGIIVTDDYPEKHKHHHGIWFAWTSAMFEGRKTDFWNMGKGLAGIQNIDYSPAWAAGSWAGISFRNRYEDKTSGSSINVLEERIDVVIRSPLANDPAVIIDLTVTQNCLTDKPLILPTYHYGGLGMRGHGQWDGEGNALFLTSTGKDRKEGNFTRANWTFMGGHVDGKPAGVALFCHPENFRAPQPVRLHPHEPFFCFAPSQLGDWSITPGIPYVARYRLIVTDGTPNADAIEQRWQTYAHPPQATWNGKLVR